MIDQLTQSQIQLMNDYVRWGVDIGLSTQNLSQEETEDIINEVYSILLMKQFPERVVVMSSPYAIWNYICKTSGVVIDFVIPYLCGSFDSNIFTSYDFFMDVLGVDIEPDLLRKYKVWRRTQNLGPIYPFDDICLVSKKPTKVCKKGNVVHNDNGPAIEYEDGFSVYMLNGVRMKKKYVETLWDQIDVRSIIQETNAEVRRELVRKIGIERIIKELGATVIDRANRVSDALVNTSADNEYEYELLLLDIGDGRKRPYLKMKNPSIGVYHIEGVHPECKTVRDALIFRNRKQTLPDMLT